MMRDSGARRWQRMGVALTMFLLVGSRSFAAVQLLDDGGFEGESFSSLFTSQFSAWRFFSTSFFAASGATTSDAAEGTRAFRLTRSSTSGDAGIDRSPAALRPFINPGRSYKLSFMAKSPANRIILARATQYNTAGTALAAPLENSWALGGLYRQFEMTFVAAADASSVDVAFRMSGGTGDVFIDAVKLIELETAAPAPPRVVLPAGVTTARRPVVEWRAADHDAFEVVVSTLPSPVAGVVWGSGPVSGSSGRIVAGADLPTSTTLYSFARVKNSIGWSDWNPTLSPFRIEPTPQLEGVLCFYDISHTHWTTHEVSHDEAHIASALQGIVNRDAPRLYISMVKGVTEPWGDTDLDWLEKLREPGAWLEKADLRAIPDMVTLVQTFRSFISGVVLWDPNVPATSNVASTVAGVEDVIPIRYDPSPGSAYSQLVTGGPRLPVRVNLVGKFTGSGLIPDVGRASTGSAKNDAYLWAKAQYLDTGKCSPLHMGYYIDAYWMRVFGAGDVRQNHTLTNHDFFVANKGFFWDLSPWGDETPVDDTGQTTGTDLATLKEILASAYARHDGKSFTHVGGFPPWAYKYTNYGSAGGNHAVVDTEGEAVKLLSAYNAYLDADALTPSALANASLFRLMPLPERYSQVLPPMPDELRDRGLLDVAGRVARKSYLLHYAGDYDSSAWIINALYPRWDEAARGSVPLGWPVTPAAALRARPAFEYMMRTRTRNDSLIAADSGAGYVNPTQLLSPRVSGLPSADQAWIAANRPAYQAFDYAFTGFLLNGYSGTITAAAEQMYQSFSGEGVVDQYRLGHTSSTHLEGTMPVMNMGMDLTGDATVDMDRISDDAGAGTANFFVFRSVLQKPSYLASLDGRLDSERAHHGYRFVTAPELSYLARAALGGSNTSRFTLLFDTVPARLQFSTNTSVEVAIRNDGWDTWSASGSNAVRLSIDFTPNGVRRAPAYYALPRDVAPGDSVVMTINVEAPSAAGNYDAVFDMVQGTTGWFSAAGDAAVRMPVEITTMPVPVTMSSFSLE